MRVCIIGTGYVGLVTGACLAENGNDVWCVDVDRKKIEGLREGRIPIYEPGLEDIVRRNVSQNRLRFTSDLKEGLDDSLFVFIAVGTPPMEDGSADLGYVFAAAAQIGTLMDGYKIIVAKSTIPVGTTERVKEIIDEKLRERKSDIEFDVAFCPEFLKEGAAVEDCLRPDRIVIGTSNERTAEFLKELFAPFVMKENRFYTMSIPSAEMTKYASNAMLATRISFMNELSRLCEKVGADVDQVRVGMGTDSRIGSSFLYAGLGYGGSCFPKDVQALIHCAASSGVDLSILKAVEETNREQRRIFIRKITGHFGEDLSEKVFALWGLSFKPHTDDMREAPALTIAEALLSRGGSIRAFDPVAMDRAKELLPEDGSVIFCDDAYEALDGTSALVLVTEWPQFRRPDWDRIKELMKPDSAVFDGRNQLSPARVRELGFSYYGIGRV
ncbi:MAG TPA: UDP-glucose/GDP-mannose dehydrogenase family protein [Synergistales bacterium]|jgi:UDPglucose 6-dehydrogenase|nr:UDP-glucose/GDP-mannose dehydrogenase family protein [Synergistales bacterium]HRV71538.1 UDP-glucose/GDP-mannose dehydrogenase family protein [Thermovirgaceae bacterium]